MERREFINYGYPILVLALGVVLSFTALPRVRAALNHLPVDTAIRELDNRHDLNPEKVKSLVITAQKSIALYDYPGYWADLSQLLFFQVEHASSLHLNQQSLLKQIQYSIERSLIRSPANSMLWFQLARAHVLLNSVSDKTLKALMLSIMTGPYEYGHLLPRLHLCLLFQDKFDTKDQFLLHSQVLIAWEKAPQIFIKEIALKNNNMSKIRFLLQNKSPDVLSAMETEIEKIPQ
jgi:hypothetical protein